jgi:hypothetical protein
MEQSDRWISIAQQSSTTVLDELESSNILHSLPEAAGMSWTTLFKVLHEIDVQDISSALSDGFWLEERF